MKISIVLVNYNTLTLLQQCLSHLSSILDPDWAQIIVVDNASTDGSASWLQTQVEEVNRVILLKENLGFAAGCNRGIEQAQAPDILLLNTDAFPQPGSLEQLVDYLTLHPQVGIVAPQLIFPDGRWQRSGGLIPSPRSAMLDAFGITSFLHLASDLRWRFFGTRQAPRAVSYVDGACMMIRRQVIQETGGLDERFFLFVEDAEYCQRVRRAGWSVHQLPSSEVVHLRGGSSSKKSLEKSARMRLDSERILVLQTFGIHGWQRFLRWRSHNYWARMLLARVTGREQRYETYRLLWRVYREQHS